MPVTNRDPQVILIEDAPSRRIVTTYDFTLQPRAVEHSLAELEFVLRDTYKQLQLVDRSQNALDVGCSILFHYSTTNKSPDVVCDFDVIIYCKDELLFCDVFDKALSKKLLCSQAGGRAELKQMRLTSFRGQQTKHLN